MSNQFKYLKLITQPSSGNHFFTKGEFNNYPLTKVFNKSAILNKMAGNKNTEKTICSETRYNFEKCSFPLYLHFQK